VELVGREREALTLRAAYREAVDARATRTVLLTGPAGIGKSSICTAIAEDFAASGARVATGICSPPGAMPLAYGPFVTAWRAAEPTGSGFSGILAGHVFRLVAPWRLDELAAELEAAMGNGALVKIRAYTELNGQMTVLVNPSRAAVVYLTRRPEFIVRGGMPDGA